MRESVRMLLAPPKLLSYLDLFRDNLWPGGRLRPPGVPRTAEDRKLSSLVLVRGTQPTFKCKFRKFAS